MGFLGDVAGFAADLDDGVGDGVRDLFHDLFTDGTSQDMVRQLALLADQVEQLGRRLVADAATMNWQGEAADSFREHSAQLSQQFAAVSDELREAADLAGKLI